MPRRFLATNSGAREWICSLPLNLPPQSLSPPQLTSLLKSFANPEWEVLLRAVDICISCEEPIATKRGVEGI